jgi:hypothetical protein
VHKALLITNHYQQAVPSNSNNKIKVNTNTEISISKLSEEARNSNYKHLIEITKIKGSRRRPRGVSIFKALIELIKKRSISLPGSRQNKNHPVAGVTMNIFPHKFICHNTLLHTKPCLMPFDYKNFQVFGPPVHISNCTAR